MGVPSSFTRTDGSVPKGTLSVPLKRLRANDLLGGDELRMLVDDVGSGVGRDSFPSNTSRDRFRGFGRTGEDERGSKAGRRDADNFFLPTLSGSAPFRGEGRSMSLSCGRYQNIVSVACPCSGGADCLLLSPWRGVQRVLR